MKIIIDIGHPGHVHYFKNLIRYLNERGHEFLIIAREKDIIINLLIINDIPFVKRGEGKNSRIGKFRYMLKADILIYKLAKKFKPDLFLSFSSPYAAQVSFLLGKPNIALNDTEHTDKIHSVFTYPFCSSILTPKSYLTNLGIKQIRFNSVVESLYLDKNFYQPNIDIKNDLNLKDGQPYVVLRFVSWNAHHDYGQSGLDYETKIKLIELLKNKFKVFISSEGELSEEFKAYQLNISPEKMHDVLAFADLFIGESATMASESSLLGTQSVYINSLPLMGYLKFEQDSGLLKHFESTEGVIKYVENLVQESDLKLNALKKAHIMKRGFINTTTFLAWFIENYPQSEKIMKDDSNYQNIFISN